MSRDPVGWLERHRARYGECFSSKFPFFGHLVYVSDPGDIKRVFAGDIRVFHAGEANSIALGPVFGTYSLLTLDEDEHVRQRKLLLPPFHGQAVRRYGEATEEITGRKLDSWPLGAPFPLRPRMQAITLDVILRTVFGVREEARLRAFRSAISKLAGIGNALVWLPPFRRELGRFSPAARFRRVRDAADELIYDEIRSRRALPEEERSDDVLSLLLEPRHEGGSRMSDEELRDELMTLLGDAGGGRGRISPAPARGGGSPRVSVLGRGARSPFRQDRFAAVLHFPTERLNEALRANRGVARPGRAVPATG